MNTSDFIEKIRKGVSKGNMEYYGNGGVRYTTKGIKEALNKFTNIKEILND